MNKSRVGPVKSSPAANSATKTTSAKAMQKLDEAAEGRNWQPSIRSKSSSVSGQAHLASAMSINKQHLSARVKSITAKLLESHGAELRRTLFSLRQIFQDDSDLAAEFIESDGLECLMKVAINADQIHQNYILRALGQLIAYPSGMNGLMRHNKTIQWLYSLLSSQHRLVVKTSLKLLLLFTEHSMNNCLLLCHAIKSIENFKGVPLWTNVIQLIHNSNNVAPKDGNQQQEVLVDTMTLINRVLSAIPDQEMYDKFMEPLEESAIMNKSSGPEQKSRVFEQRLKSDDATMSTDNAKDTITKPLREFDLGCLHPNIGLIQDGGSDAEKANPKQDDENTDIHDDNYESANESSNETHNKQHVISLSPNKEEQKHCKQEQAPSNPIAKQQNNLARGKHQRASISSCSSSDSYASYGSGYASGSGNSTDHEHKQKSLPNTDEKTNQQQQQQQQPSLITAIAKLENKTDSQEINTEIAKLNDGGVDDDHNHDDDNSQLKQHLTELEQLTDDLAARNIFGSISKPTQSTSKNFSPSNSSSILSTGSESLSSSTTVANHEDELQSKTQNTSLLPNVVNDESRSTSTTPTSSNQPNSTSTLSSYGVQQTYLTTHQQTNNGDKADSEAQARLAPTRPNQQQYKQRQVVGDLPVKQQPTSDESPSSASIKQEPYYHNLFQWEQLVSKGVNRPLLINDLDFTDLKDEDDCDLLNAAPTSNNQSKARNQTPGEPLTINIPASQGVGQNSSVDSGTESGSPGNVKTPANAPPPPPMSPWFNTIIGSRPQSQLMSTPSPPFEFSGEQQQPSTSEFNRDQSPSGSNYSNYSRNSVCEPPSRESSAQFNALQPVSNLRAASSMSSLLFGNNGKYSNKRKKTMKLFWKEVREDRSLLSRLTKKKTIWDEIKPIQVDTQKLEYLFESKARDLFLSKSRNGLDTNQRKVKITVLDAKRSNSINIGMTKLPPMRTIKSAILKMDSSIMNREGIEKILTTMMPSEEEKSRIIEAQLANPDTPLGTAEQFLLNLASISALEARLKLWAFQLDYAQIEKEVAEPLMDLKQAIEEIEKSETFRIILGTLLAIGNFLNSTSIKGFQLDYLEKVPEVKDTVHKHSLLHHLCLFIQEKYDPQLTSDLYSEFSAVNRASKIDYTEVTKNLKKMQQDCKASWDYLKIVAKHDGLTNLMNTCGISSSNDNSPVSNQQLKSSGKLNNLSKLSMITTVIGVSDSTSNSSAKEQQQAPTSKQRKTKVSDFLTDCAERIMVLMVIHRRVMNRFQKLLVYLGCPSHQIKQTQPQHILKVINEFALEYRTKRERVKEMLMKRHQCQHRNHHQPNKWHLNRSRWAGSQQCIESLGYNQCTDSMCALSRHHVNQQQHLAANRASSPSGLSQVSNYSDYMFDHSCCNSRQQSITPVPSERGYMYRPQSMFDLQNQQACREAANNDANNPETTEVEQELQKDDQLRRLLGSGKTFDGTYNDLYQMSHWSTTMARVSRRPPNNFANTKLRAVSMDSPCNDEELERRQSSYYKYLHNCQSMDDEQRQNSDDDEILECLVRTATAKSSQNQSVGMQNGARRRVSAQFDCERKSTLSTNTTAPTSTPIPTTTTASPSTPPTTTSTTTTTAAAIPSGSTADKDLATIKKIIQQQIEQNHSENRITVNKPSQMLQAPDFAPESIEARVADATSQFGLLFLRNLSSDVKDNVVISPMSLQSLMNMVFLGSGDQSSSQLELARVLNYESTNLSGSTPTDRLKAHEAMRSVLQSILTATHLAVPNEVASELLNTNSGSLQATNLTAHLQTSYKEGESPLSEQLNFTLANLVLTNKDVIELKDDYQKELKSFYDVKIEQFSRDKTVDTNNKSSDGRPLHERINSWVKTKTHDQIEKLADESDLSNTDLVMVLLNAAHFKGQWLHTFSSKATVAGTFFNHGNELEASKVKFMRQKNTFGYADFGISSLFNDGLGSDIRTKSSEDAETLLTEDNAALKNAGQVDKTPSSDSAPTIELSKDELRRMDLTSRLNCSVLMLPFSINDGQELSMMILLPAKRDGLDNLQAALDGPTLNEIYRSLSEQQVQVELPKFSFDSSIDAKNILMKMGLRSIFNDSANLDRMYAIKSGANIKAMVDKIVHKAKINVDESGAEAAAASMATIVLRNFIRPPTPVFVADHPFLFIIRHNRSNMPLFMGRVTSL